MQVFFTFSFKIDLVPTNLKTLEHQAIHHTARIDEKNNIKQRVYILIIKSLYLPSQRQPTQNLPRP